jgi:hypothetical protein
MRPESKPPYVYGGANLELEYLVDLCIELGGMMGINTELISKQFIIEHASAVEAEFEMREGEVDGFDYLSFNEEEVVMDGIDVMENGLNKVLEKKINNLRSKRVNDGGLSIDMIRSYFNGYDKVEDVIKLLKFGPLVCQRDN